MTGLQNRSTRGIPIDGIAGHSQAARTDLHTTLPGRVVDFDAEKQTMTVAMLYQAKVEDDVFDMPDLLEVPISIPRSGGYAITFPFAKNDPVQVTFSGRSLEQWRKDPTTKHYAPQRRVQDFSDAIASPGMQSPSEALSSYSTENLVIRDLAGETLIEIGSGKFAIEGSSGEELLTILHETLDLLRQEPALIFTPLYLALRDRLATIKLR